MKEQDRFQELYKYKILDTPPDKELDELAEIASAICDTPISLISLIDESRQWFKARKGFDIQETPRKDSFCQHALQHPKEVLVINDPLNDKRFQNNPFVYGQPYIRFYAGAPLETPQGNVLGTLCVIDNKPRNISENQKKALQLLAKKVMSYLEDRKLIIEQADKIELTASRLKKITDQVPGAIYQFESSSDGKISFQFISKGISDIHPCLKPEELKEKLDKILNFIHPNDLALVQKSFQESISNLTEWDIEFRIVSDDGSIIWVLY